MSKKKITITMTEDQAVALGILRCECGHPENNHFDHGSKPCAHCPCKQYVQVVVLPKGYSKPSRSEDGRQRYSR